MSYIVYCYYDVNINNNNKKALGTHDFVIEFTLIIERSFVTLWSEVCGVTL